VSPTIAVTGATGFIGRHLVARLVANGCEVRAVVRPDSRHAAPSEATIVRAPLVTDRLTEAFAGADAVVHLAGLVRARSAADFTQANVDGTRAVAGAARNAGARLIHVSSLAAAGSAPAAAPRREADPPAPITPYGASKLAGEQAVAATTRLRWTILRPGVVYGPQDAALLALFRMAERGILPLVGRRGAAYTFIHIDDVVRVIEAAVHRPADGRTMFVGHREPVTPRVLLEQIRSAVGRPAVVVPIPLPLARAAAALSELTSRLTGRLYPLDRWRYAELASEGFVCRVDLMRELLNVEAEVSLAKGLARTAAWYREQRWLRPVGSVRL
jgi:nucleoside-diphosphate-sugar epimerase